MYFLQREAMFKTFVTLAITFFLFASSADVLAATKKAKRKISKTTDGKLKNHYSKSNKRRSKKYSNYKRYGGSTVSLKTLTTESPYTENTDNGINPVETKLGIQ